VFFYGGALAVGGLLGELVLSMAAANAAVAAVEEKAEKALAA
jgi:hypothetical protein